MSHRRSAMAMGEASPKHRRKASMPTTTNERGNSVTTGFALELDRYFF